MPLGTLRKKSSAKDLNRRSKIPYFTSDTPPPPPPPSALTTSPPKKVPVETDSPSLTPRPASSHHPTSSPRPELPRRPSSPRSHSAQRSSQLLDIPRNRQSLRFASEPDLNGRYKAQARRSSSPLRDVAAPAPTIGITAPPQEDNGAPEKNAKRRTLLPFGNALSFRSSSYGTPTLSSRKSDVGAQPQSQRLEPRESSSSIERPAMSSQVDGSGPSPLRHSESSAHHTSSSNPFSSNGVSSKASSLFRFSRRKKNEPLFPLPVKVSPPTDPSKSVSNASSDSPTHTHSSSDYIPPVPPIPGNAMSHSNGPSSDLGRNGSAASAHSAQSSPPVTIAPTGHPHPRSRSGTMKSTNDSAHTPHLQDSGRNSTASTTLGRNSIAGLRSLTSRLRHPSEGLSPRYGSPGGTLGNNSFALSRETLVVPEREEGESAGKYYARLEKDMQKRSIAVALSKSPEQFNKDVLRSLLRTFKFYEEPMDMSLRKFLWEVSLPGEAQQIDRVIGAFAERYHECNPHIFNNLDQANFISYSLIILHSDLFNPNNKRKMQRHEYQRNVRDQGIPPEILGYFYDNIQYTEFIAQNADEEGSESKSKAASKKAKRVKQRLAAPDATKNGRIDPYVVIIDDHLKLDTLKPILRDELSLEDTYSYMGTLNHFDIPRLRAQFARFGRIQITSARSRPEAFTSPTTTQNPDEATPGVVDIHVAKVGIVWRKSAKRKKTRSPWQEWGAILSPSQLYFSRNVTWVKNLCHQADVHHKQGNSSVACIFKPPVTNLGQDGRVMMDEAVALVDTSYRRHKHAFVLARRGQSISGDSAEQHFEETILAQDEMDMNDWLCKINYASAFKTSNVRMHSWHPGCRMQPTPGISDAPADDSEPMEGNQARPAQRLLSANEKALNLNVQNALIRAQMTREKFASAKEDLEPKEKTLDVHVRTARHLEILAPLNEKTKGDLLSFGVRLAHNIRWHRYEVSRLRVHRDILFKEMQEDEVTTSKIGPSNVDPNERLYTVDSRLDNVRRGSKSDPAPGDNRRDSAAHIRTVKSESTDPQGIQHATYRNSDILSSISEAFATPPETITQIENTGEGSLRLLTLSDAARIDERSPDSPAMHSASSFRRSSVSSVSSWPRTAQAGALTPTPGDRREAEGRRPSTASGSETGRVIANSPHSSSKSKARRSLQRTLRDPRNELSAQSSRSNKNKKVKERDSVVSGDTDDAASAHGSEGLARRKGSFTVHGKKASVITIPEWEQKSAEERLRLRKQAASDTSRNMSVDGTTDDEGSAAVGHRLSDAFSSSVAEESAAESEVAVAR